MEATTGGFRALRSHVKAAKASSPRNATSSGHSDEDERSETTQRCNQEAVLAPTLDQEKQLYALRAAVMKEHQYLQARERSIRSMERTLDDEFERISKKERHLDTRILEITMLEARLHEALLEQEQNNQQEPQEVEPASTNNGQDDREAVLDLREKKLACAKAHVDEKEKHLQAKERVLQEKEAELASLEAKLQRKDKERESASSKRIKVLEDNLRASAETSRAELEAQRVLLEKREAGVACRERATTVKALALDQFERLLAQQDESSLMTQEDLLARSGHLQAKIEVVEDHPLEDNDRDSRVYRPAAKDNHRQNPDVDQPQRLKRKGTFGRFFK